ncbi:hypothetical protein UFOVP116_338 [uncultured Caudovirales phage]|uniref:Uncharacterized protein n=1 Tax=uncultured Caudovirales phage TaxID=2100421 RepID=A0A6J5LB38_9CAUD|nr:hypothetical protein UFOVP116_338 [uncultured Caudovirales phage]
MSNINPNNVDGTYPIAGQDNDSQGFRDNFTNIKNNLSFAKSELEDLAAKVLLKSPLIGTVLNNEMNDAGLSGAKIKDFGEVVSDHGIVTGLVVLDHTAGHYHTMTLNSDVMINFLNWPLAGSMGRIRVAIDVPSNQFILTLPDSVTTGLDSISGAASGKIQFLTPGVVIFEFTTSNGGLSVAINDLSRARLADLGNQTSVLNADVAVTSSTPTDLGLRFETVATTRYSFSALIPFQTYSNGDNSVVFTIGHAGGATCFCNVEIQEDTQFKTWTITASDDVAAASSQFGNSIRMCKINGVFTSGAAGTVNIRVASMRNMWIAKAGASMICTRLGAAS